MKTILKQLILGQELPQEYICLNAQDLDLHMEIMAKWELEDQLWDVKNEHILLGYKPLIIGIREKIIGEKKIGSVLIMNWLNFDLNHEKPTAVLSLRLTMKIACNSEIFCVFEGIKGTHQLIKKRYQLGYQLREYFLNRPASQLPLKGNLYDQVRIAYAYPRLISLISLAKQGKMNMFPTDLNGPVGEKSYILSLRSAGKAYAQLCEVGKCLLAHMESDQYKKVYQLGKNHMQELKDKKCFDFETYSSRFGFPVPHKIVEYRELTVQKEWKIGIHTLLFCQVNAHYCNPNAQSKLAHVHSFYLRWLQNQGKSTKLLVR